LYKFTSKLVVYVLLATAVLSTSLAYASGGTSFPLAVPEPREVDQVYELGKQIYKGRSQDAVKIKYCVKQQDGEFKKLKGSTAKPFRGGISKDFALSTVADGQIPLVLYYLNKRYRLNLQN